MGNIQTSNNFNYKNSDIPQPFRSFFENLPKSSEKRVRNPGLFDDLDEVWENIQPKGFEGIRVSLAQEVTDKVEVQNTVKVDPSKPNDYNITSKIVSNAEFPLIWCELDQRGILKTKFVHNASDQVCLKAIGHLFPNNFEVPKLSVDYRGDDFTATFMFRYLRNQARTGTSIAAQYLQSITKEFAFGFEYSFKFGHSDPSSVALVARYSLCDAILSGKLEKNSGCIRFWREVTPLLQIGFEVYSDFNHRNATGAISYQWNVPKNGLVVRGSLDSQFTASAIIDKTLMDYPLTLCLSFGYNYATNNLKSGVGLEAQY